MSTRGTLGSVMRTTYSMLVGPSWALVGLAGSKIASAIEQNSKKVRGQGGRQVGMAPAYGTAAQWLVVEILVVHPEIPQNTGCAARLAAALGLRLHLVEPLGFSLEDRYLKRAGLDYWPLVDLRVHASLDQALAELGSAGPGALEERLHLFTARGGRSLFQTDFAPGDLLVFGRESVGLPPELLARWPERRVYIPIRAGVRSLNLANAISVAVYTALVRAGVPLPENDGAYHAHPEAQRDVWPSERVTTSDQVRSAGSTEPGTLARDSQTAQER